MRGGKLLNNWRMAQLHAQEAPDRVLELEEWGALFDRTKDGLILQRDFGGHRYARLAHVGDRTGLEMIRTLQQHAVHKGIDVYMECNRPAAAHRRRPDRRRVRLLARERQVRAVQSKAVVLATGGVGKAWKITSNSWEYTGDGLSMALDAGADLIDMEMVQFHPTGMVWPPSVRGILVTEGVRGDGGTLKNTKGERFMFDYIPEFFRAETADTEEEADALVRGQAQQPAHAGPAARATRSRARSIARSKPAAAPRTAASSWISRRADPADYIQRRLPSMYHQFKELADVDITKTPMEVGPTCHYSMGGVRVDADTTATTVPGSSPRARSPPACTAPTAWAATRSPTCWCSGGAPACTPPSTQSAARLRDRSTTIRSTPSRANARALRKQRRRKIPYAIHADLQDCMQNLVGIIRIESELQQALDDHSVAGERPRNVKVDGNRHYNPGWHLALDLHCS